MSKILIIGAKHVGRAQLAELIEKLIVVGAPVVEQPKPPILKIKPLPVERPKFKPPAITKRKF